MPLLKRRLTTAGASAAMREAESYAQWFAAAQQRDRETGHYDWRETDDSEHLNAALMRRDIADMQQLRQSARMLELAALLRQSIYRHQGDIANPHLYRVAFSGTKQVVDDYLQAVTETLNFLSDSNAPELGAAAKRQLLSDASRNLGQSALLLSGGASMGFFHLGVVKALHGERLLPDTLCGASIGSLMGGGVCSRNDAELDELFANPESIYRFGIQFLKPAELLKQKALLNQQQLLECAQQNVADMTFAEATAHSGRHFSVSVSPGRARQKPQLLSAKTSPDVLIANAILASCAIPGVYPPVSLQSRADGEVSDYLPGEKWVDGTFQGDLPMKRLGRLFNINHFIVSQVNPHALPFLVSRQSRGLAGLVADLALSSAQKQTAQTLKVLQSRVANPTLHNVMEHGRLLAEQEYKGDINIHPPLSLWMYRRMLSNPNREDLNRYIRLGEQATWPMISQIRHQTQIQNTVKACLRKLENQP